MYVFILTSCVRKHSWLQHRYHIRVRPKGPCNMGVGMGLAVNVRGIWSSMSEESMCRVVWLGGGDWGLVANSQGYTCLSSHFSSLTWFSWAPDKTCNQCRSWSEIILQKFNLGPNVLPNMLVQIFIIITFYFLIYFSGCMFNIIPVCANRNIRQTSQDWKLCHKIIGINLKKYIWL